MILNYLDTIQGKYDTHSKNENISNILSSFLEKVAKDHQLFYNIKKRINLLLTFD
jgi:hypothetical protein